MALNIIHKKHALWIEITVIFFILMSAAQGGVPYEQWSKTFGGTNGDDAHFVQQTSDGGFIFAGSTSSYGAGDSDAWLVKADTNGNEQWSKTFGGTSTEWANSVQQTSDGGYIFTGMTTSYGSGGSDAWLVKADTNGNEQWSKTFGGTNEDVTNYVLQTSDSGYIIAGTTGAFIVGNVFHGGGNDAWLIKTDVNGNEKWNKTFGGATLDAFRFVQQTSEGGYILAGSTSSYGAGGSDAWVLKTDSNGNEQWNKTFGGSAQDYGQSIRKTSDGGYIIGGQTNSYGSGETDVWLIKIDANGNQLWNQKFGGTQQDYFRSLLQESDGGYVIAGFTQSYGAGNYDAWLIRTDALGNEQWNKTFGGTAEDNAQSIQKTSDGGYFIGGLTKSSGAGLADAWLIKLSNNPPTSTPTLTVTPKLIPTITSTSTPIISPTLTPTSTQITTQTPTISYTGTTTPTSLPNVNQSATHTPTSTQATPASTSIPETSGFEAILVGIGIVSVLGLRRR